MTNSSSAIKSMIRLADAADVPDIFDVRTSVRDNHMTIEELAEEGITPDALPGMLDGSGRGWVAEVDGRVVAFAMVDADEATVFALFVRPEFEGQGLGKILLEVAEAWLVEQGLREIWLVTDKDLTVRANGFYRHLGWRDDGIQADGQVRLIKAC
ncbi:GNAT family N-acetyltransferase [Rhodococcus erythropolis]|uniref:GNAT family N-acetyltransferase n=1 Tax=Rhodococcus TaxID=1827 RepID=UPI0010E5D7D5|nr:MULTISPECIES: GNAT family N-acetyltransferase [Rhodococcus]MDV6208091.1 GNAT family N-acetyltransferase [Rhodococcus erythropolis]